MNINNTNLDIIQSPTAERMLKAVTKDFYGNSSTALWMFEVIGHEYDEMGNWARNLRYETRPQTCTWSIGIWEFIYEIEPDDTIPLEVRRQRILSKRLSRPPINPDRIAATLSALSGCPVKIIDPITPYTFKVIIDESKVTVSDHSAVLKLLRTIKPSHLSFRYEVIIQREYAITDYYLGAASEYIQESFYET